MATTYTAISTITVGAGGAATIDFTSIPQTYNDLVIKLSGRNDGSGNGVNITFNGNTTGYTNSSIQGSGSATTSYGTYNRLGPLSTYSTETASTFSYSEVYIPSYSSSTINKAYSADGCSENNATTAYITLTAGLWSNTAAITSISLANMSGNFVQHAKATLYGIKNT